MAFTIYCTMAEVAVLYTHFCWCQTDIHLPSPTAHNGEETCTADIAYAVTNTYARVAVNKLGEFLEQQGTHLALLARLVLW